MENSKDSKLSTQDISVAEDVNESTNDPESQDDENTSNEEDSADEALNKSSDEHKDKTSSEPKQKRVKRGPYQRRNIKKIYSCTDCGLKLLKYIDYRSHRRKHRESREPSVLCGLCPEKFFFHKDLKKHIVCHREGPTKIFCSECEFHCFSENVLAKHVKSQHVKHVFVGNSIKSKSPFGEQKLSKKITNPETPLRSIFECKVCSLCFDLKRDVYKHEKFHLPQKVQWRVTCKKLDSPETVPGAFNSF